MASVAPLSAHLPGLVAVDDQAALATVLVVDDDMVNRKLIGAALFLSPKTVANNVSLILDKVHVAHRAEAIVTARDAGIGHGH